MKIKTAKKIKKIRGEARDFTIHFKEIKEEFVRDGKKCKPSEDKCF